VVVILVRVLALLLCWLLFELKHQIITSVLDLMVLICLCTMHKEILMHNNFCHNNNQTFFVAKAFALSDVNSFLFTFQNCPKTITSCVPNYLISG
jgi:hypothetical protein